MTDEDTSGEPVASSQQPVVTQDSNAPETLPPPVTEPETVTVEVPPDSAEPEVVPSEVVEASPAPDSAPPPPEAPPTSDTTGGHSTEGHSETTSEGHSSETAPDSAKATTGTQSPAQTAQTHGFEPLDPAHDKPDATATVGRPQVSPQPASRSAKERSIKGNVRKQEKRREKIEKLLTEIEKRGKISNDEVEKLLRVSDATATRYLSALEKDGKIKQVGKTGIGVVYTKTASSG